MNGWEATKHIRNKMKLPKSGTRRRRNIKKYSQKINNTVVENINLRKLVENAFGIAF